MKTLTLQYDEPIYYFKKYACAQSISESVKQKYTSSFNETSSLSDYGEVKKRADVVTVAYEDLPNKNITGFPLGSDRNGKGELQYSFAKDASNTHIINIGTTGSGKTTGFVEPGLRALSSKKNKPNLFLTDPKGELFERNAEYLKKRGYRLFLINFKDVIHSDCWNPLSEIYDVYIRQKNLKGSIKLIKNPKKLSEYHRHFFPDKYTGAFWVYKNDAYPTEKEAVKAYEGELADILSETADLVHQLVHTLIPDSLQSKQDPSWFMGAQEILSGVIYAMLEDSLDERYGLNRDNMNLMTVQNYFDRIRKEVLCGFNQVPLLRTNKLSHKSDNDQSIKQLKSYFENAPTTTRSYLGCFRNAMQGWFNNKMFTVCNGNTVELESDDRTPFAIFLITRDFEKSDFTIAGMFIDWVYRKMLEKADLNHGRLENELYFILDEFANIPPIKDFENKIATSRSRNIWFHIFIQSYVQLEMVYGGATAQTIMDNCNTHVFMGSENYDTKSRFARECGKQTIPSLESVLNPQNKRVVEVPLLNIRKLETIVPGQMYMKRAGMPLIRTEFIRSYNCPEFINSGQTTPQELGIESLPFNSEKYCYLFLESDMKMADFIKEREKPMENSNDFSQLFNEVI